MLLLAVDGRRNSYFFDDEFFLSVNWLLNLLSFDDLGVPKSKFGLFKFRSIFSLLSSKDKGICVSTSCSRALRVNPKIVLWGSKKVKEEYFLNWKNSISICFLSRLIAQQNMRSSSTLFKMHLFLFWTSWGPLLLNDRISTF